MKRILILGVDGFIGHHLSHRIITSTDWEVYGMDMQSERIADPLIQRDQLRAVSMVARWGGAQQIDAI